MATLSTGHTFQTETLPGTGMVLASDTEGRFLYSGSDR